MVVATFPAMWTELICREGTDSPWATAGRTVWIMLSSWSVFPSVPQAGTFLILPNPVNLGFLTGVGLFQQHQLEVPRSGLMAEWVRKISGDNQAT